MGLIKRTISVFRAKFNKYLSTQEDPMEKLEMTYEDMRSERREMKKSIVNVKAQRKSLERKVSRFEDEIEEHNEQARAAMEQGEEDLSRQALEQKKAKVDAVDDLQENIDEIEETEEQMYEKLDEIDGRISELKTQKEILKARYEGAEAMSSINESISGELGDYSVDENVDDIHEEIDEMKSRAEAIQEFDEERAEENVEKQLDSVSTDSVVDEEMETLRAEFNQDVVEVADEPEKEVELE